MNANVINAFSGEMGQRIGWALVHFLWQGTLLAIVLAVTLQMLHRRRAQVRYVAACCGLGLLAVMPIVTAMIISPARVDMALATTPPPAPSPAAVATGTGRTVEQGWKDMPGDSMVATPRQAARETAVKPAQKPIEPARVSWIKRFEERIGAYLPLAVVLWMVGVVGLSLWHVGGWMVLQRMRRKGKPPGDARVVEVFARLMKRLGVRQAVKLLESAAVRTPVVIGWMRPVILVPVCALTGLSLGQIEAILAHELAHVRRWDCLVRMIQAVVETMLFFHPAVWWVSGRVKQESENCCDELALEICGDREEYARALAQVAGVWEAGAGLAVAASGGKLLPRLRRILGISGQRSMGRTLLSAGVALVLVAGMVIVPLACAGKSSTTQANKLSAEKTTLVVQLVDEQGKPVENQSLSLERVREGYSEQLNDHAGPFYADKQGKVTIEGIEPGKYRFVTNQGWPAPTFLEFMVPAGGLTTRATVRAKTPDADWPDLDVEVSVRAKEGQQTGTLLDVVVSNNTDRAYALSATDLKMYSEFDRVYPPASQRHEGAVVPAKGKGVLRLTLDWDEYCHQGLWCSMNGEDIEWKGPTDDEKGVYYRVCAGITESLGVALKEPVKWAVWGEAKNGIQVRARVEKETWGAGEMPAVVLDLRNVGDKTVTYGGFAPWECEVWMDDKWYGWWQTGIFDGAERLRSLKPGETATGAMRVILSSEWAQSSREDGEHLKVGSGRHTVRVCFEPATGGMLYQNKLPNGTVSNPVEITVTTQAGTEPEWGEAKDGIQVRARAEKENWDEGETPVIDLDLRNVGQKAVEYLGDDQIECQIFVDDKPFPWPERGGFVGTPRLLKPGETAIDAVRVRLKGDWDESRRDHQEERLKFWGGRHTVQVRFTPLKNLNSPQAGSDSNPVQIMVAEAATGTLLKTVDGKLVYQSHVKGIPDDGIEVDPGPDTYMRPLVIPLVVPKPIVESLRLGKDGSFFDDISIELMATKTNVVALSEGFFGMNYETAGVKSGYHIDIKEGKSAAPSKNRRYCDGLLLISVVNRGTCLLRYSADMNVLDATDRSTRIDALDADVRWEVVENNIKPYDSASRPTSDPATRPVWGEAKDGIQVRARVEKENWGAGETPVVLLDVRNVGEKTIHYLGYAPADCRVVVDDKWYGWSKPIALAYPIKDLKPGEMARGAVRVALSGEWAEPSKDERVKWASNSLDAWGDHLKLGAGAHTVQVDFGPGLNLYNPPGRFGNGQDKRKSDSVNGISGPPSERMSNPVQITVVAQAATQPSEAGGDKSVVIHGMVVDEKGNAVAGTVVEEESDRLKTADSAAAARTGRDGRFELRVEDDVPAHRRVLGASSGDGSLQGIIAQVIAGDVKIVLKPAREFTFTVKDKKGEAAADARVGAIMGFQVVAEAKSDAEGKGVLRVPADAELSDIFAVKEGVGLDYFAFWGKQEVLHKDPYHLAADYAGPVAFVLNGATPVIVRVEDEEHHPLAGAAVNPWYLTKPKKGEMFNLGLWPTQLSDERGLARFGMIPQDNVGIVPFWVRKKGYTSPQRWEWDPASGKREITATLQRLVHVTGRVVGQDGKPVSGAKVMVGGAGYQFDDFSGNVDSAADGTFAFDVDPEMYYIFVAQKGHEVSEPERQMIHRQAGAVELKLEDGVRVYGKATMGPKNEPAGNLDISMWLQDESYLKLPKDQKFPGPQVGRKAIIPQIAQQTVTDTEGNFEFYTCPGKHQTDCFLIDDRNVQDFTVGREAKEVKIHLQRTSLQQGVLHGRVVRADNPATGVAEAVLAGQTIDLDDHGLVQPRGTSDDAGNFEIRRPFSEMYLHAASGDGKLAAIVRVKPEDDNLTISLGPTAEARGRLIGPDGKPLAGRTIEYGMKIGGNHGGPFGYFFGGDVQTGDDGTFTLKGLVPGSTYDVQLLENENGVRLGGYLVKDQVKVESDQLIELGDVSKLARRSRE